MKNLITFLLFITLANSVMSQVNLQTGSATFSLPMFNWQDDRSRLNAVAGLDYNSGNGLKVNDVASNVGQGWRLIAGGVISRMQVGEPDDQPALNVAGLTKYPAGYLYNTIPVEYGCPTSLIKYPIYKDKNHLYKQHNPVAADREMDRFSFQFNGKSGMFVLPKDSSNLHKGIFLGDTKMTVEFIENLTMSNQGVRTTIDAFTITDEDGLKYKFSQHELTTILKVSYCSPDLQIENTQPKFEDGKVYNETSFIDANIVNPYVINGWYLTEILDPLTNRKITFNYPFIRNIDASSGTSFSFYREKNYSIESHLRSVTKTPALGSIDFPDDHHVVFNYGKARIDLNGDYALSSVDVTYKARYLTKYELTTSYFIRNRYGSPFTDYQRQSARLCLLSVRKIGVDLKADEPPYYFDYYLGSNNSDDFVPPPFFHLKDIWGFYNGNNSITYENNNNNSNIPIGVTKSVLELVNNDIIGLCFIKYGNDFVVLNPKSGFAKNGLLKKIIYPTGGSLGYEYLQNEAVLQSQNKLVGGVHVSKTLVMDGGYSNNCNTAIETNYTYNAAMGSTASSLWGMETPVNSIMTSSHYSPEDKYFQYKPVLTFQCNYRYQYPGILSREQAVSLTTSQEIWMAVTAVLDVVSNIMTIVNVVNLIVASPGALVAVIIDVIASIATIAITCTKNLTRDDTVNIYYDSDINSSNPLPVQFKRVEVTESSGSNGRSVVEFTSPDDYPIWELTNDALSMKQRFAYWAYGLLKKKTVYDANGYIVTQTENLYDTSNAKRPFNYHASTIGKYPSCKCLVVKNSSQSNTNWEKPASYEAPLTYTANDITDFINVEIYQVFSGRTELKKSYERVFKPNSLTNFMETSVEYAYNENNYQVKKILTTQSNGDKNEKDITYSLDYNTGIFATLNANNIYAVPVSTITQVLKSGTANWKTLSEKVTEYLATGNGDIKPSRILERRFSQPQSISIFYLGPNNSSNPTDYVETQTFIYNANGSLIGMKDEGNRTISNIYDYDEKYIVASVINADPNLDKPAYTSFETQAYGGWILNGTASFINTGAVTGTRSFGLTSSNSLSANTNINKPYKLSFWATSNNVSISSNAALIKSEPVINGFTYYEYLIPQGATSITVSGTATIDELRLYPQSSRMRTVAYDPLIGKTMECDENNRITYYEYDDLARLRYIKDEQKNIVKMYEYNYAKLSSQCPVTFSSNMAVEIFVKNDCAVGYVGQVSPYIIPAGKYTSTISQADADQQVENELIELAQSYTNSHSSCTRLFYNVAASQVFKKQGCDIGYDGTNITYSVAANKYSSTINQADANAKAQIEIDANGQAFANAGVNASCVIDTASVWISTGSEQCQSGHRLIAFKDQNPNSSSYNQTLVKDTGVSASCGVGYNTIQLANFTGYPVTVTAYNTQTSQQTPITVGIQDSEFIYLVSGTYNFTFSSSSISQVAINGCSFISYGYLPSTIYNVGVSSTCTYISIQDN